MSLHNSQKNLIVARLLPLTVMLWRYFKERTLQIYVKIAQDEAPEGVGIYWWSGGSGLKGIFFSTVSQN